MMITSEGRDSIHFFLSSESCFIQYLLQECCTFVQRYTTSEFVELKTVVHELVKNAIESGNQSCSEKNVCCNIEKLNGSQFSVTIEDERNGSENNLGYINQPDSPDPKNMFSNFSLVESLSDRLEFKNNGSFITALVSYSDDNSLECNKAAGLKGAGMDGSSLRN